MPHCDDDDLAVLALGEAPSAADDAHLQQCARCRSRLDQLTAVTASARSITDADRPTAPPPSVWAAITEELRVSDNVVSLDSRRQRSNRVWWVAAAAACVGLVIGGVATTAVSRTTAPADVVAQASLAPVGASALTGRATIERAGADTVLHVQVPDLPTLDDGYYEVWMATPDTVTMVSIGTLNPGEEGTFALPSGMDVAAFPVVDVSVEHFDGNTEHSAESVVRGSLDA